MCILVLATDNFQTSKRKFIRRKPTLVTTRPNTTTKDKAKPFSPNFRLATLLVSSITN